MEKGKKAKQLANTTTTTTTTTTTEKKRHLLLQEEEEEDVISQPIKKNKRGSPNAKNTGERCALKVYEFLSYKFKEHHEMTVNKKKVTYNCGNRTVGEMLWEFVTKGDLPGAMGGPGAKKGGATVKRDENSVHKCLVDTRIMTNSKDGEMDYPRINVIAYIKEALRMEGYQGRVPAKVTVSHIAMHKAGHKPSGDEMTASHRCVNVRCVTADIDLSISHMLWENIKDNMRRVNCGQTVILYDDQGRETSRISVCKHNRTHTPPCFMTFPPL